MQDYESVEKSMGVAKYMLNKLSQKGFVIQVINY